MDGKQKNKRRTFINEIKDIKEIENNKRENNENIEDKNSNTDIKDHIYNNLLRKNIIRKNINIWK